VLEALVLAKVILIGDVLRLGRRFEDKPLIVPTLYKTVVFHPVGGAIYCSRAYGRRITAWPRLGGRYRRDCQ